MAESSPDLLSPPNPDPGAMVQPLSQPFPRSSSATRVSHAKAHSRRESFSATISRSQVEDGMKLETMQHCTLWGKPRIQLEGSQVHIWPYELTLPRRIAASRSSTTSSPPKSLFPYAHTPVAMVVDCSKGGTADTMEKGGVRAETIGYGVGWDECPNTHGRPDVARHKGGKGQEPFEDGVSKIKEPEPQQYSAHGNTWKGKDPPAKGSKGPCVEPAPELPVDERHMFQLPPSFTESTSAAYLVYQLVVTVNRRGTLRENRR